MEVLTRSYKVEHKWIVSRQYYAAVLLKEADNADNADEGN